MPKVGGKEEKRLAENALKVIEADLLRGKTGLVDKGKGPALKDAIENFLDSQKDEVTDRWYARQKTVLHDFAAKTKVPRLEYVTAKAVKDWLHTQGTRRGHGAQRAKLEGRIGWNILRHTCGTWLRRIGMPANLIQAYLGHAPGSSVTWKHYVAPETEAMGEWVGKLPSAHVESQRNAS